MIIRNFSHARIYRLSLSIFFTFGSIKNVIFSNIVGNSPLASAFFLIFFLPKLNVVWSSSLIISLFVTFASLALRLIAFFLEFSSPLFNSFSLLSSFLTSDFSLEIANNFLNNFKKVNYSEQDF